MLQRPLPYPLPCPAFQRVQLGISGLVREDKAFLQDLVKTLGELAGGSRAAAPCCQLGCTLLAQHMSCRACSTMHHASCNLMKSGESLSRLTMDGCIIFRCC